MDNIKQTKFGKEIVWADTSDYCSKILIFEKQGSATPLHFHREIKKTWFVNSGKFKVVWVDTKDAKTYAQELVEGGVFHIDALTPVKLTALADNSVIAETSSKKDDNDYYMLG
jgi:quercetin dioxygenase-like cupin family protein